VTAVVPITAVLLSCTQQQAQQMSKKILKNFGVILQDAKGHVAKKGKYTSIS